MKNILNKSFYLLCLEKFFVEAQAAMLHVDFVKMSVQCHYAPLNKNWPLEGICFFKTRKNHTS